MPTKKFSHSNPHLPVKNLREDGDYYRDKLGFYEEWTWGEIDGGIRRDDMRLLFGEDPGFAGAINNEEQRLPLMWFVSNIEEIFSEFKERNVEIASPLAFYDYGLKEFAFIDINGLYPRSGRNWLNYS